MLGFQIYIAGNDWESQETIKLDVNSPTEHTINSLRCGCKYQTYLVAFNEAGNSDPSEVQTFQTLGNGKQLISADFKRNLLNIVSQRR